MRCQQCGFEARSDFKFCPACGQPLGRPCPACGAECEPGFAFCPTCGARLTEPAGGPNQRARPAPSTRSPRDLAATLRAAFEAGDAEGERRTVTVLFADLSGFTALSEVLDPEEVATIVDRCLGALAEIVDRFEGTVDKYIGDCVMALFGAPIAHEDDPERAIGAALEMCARVAAIGQELSATRPAEQAAIRLSLHVGINTGVVVAGAVGGGRRREYTVLGDAVNVAARLEAAASDGEVVVGEQTYRLAQHAFSFDPLGQLTVKGRAEPLAAYRVLGARAVAAGRRLDGRGLSAPLVGRQTELTRLEAALARTRAGRAQLVSVVGEAGVGKSRLLHELVERLSQTDHPLAAGLTLRRAHCTSRGQQPFGLVASLFQDAYGLAADEPPTVARRKVVQGLIGLGLSAEQAERTAILVGHLLGLDSGDRALPHVEPEQLKRQLFLAVLQVVERRLEHGPLVLLAEDVHWADAASVELLRFLLERLDRRPFMLLLAHRPSFDAAALLPEGASADYLAISLEPLSPADSRALLEACLGSSAEPVPERLRAAVVDRAGGNPLYLEEVLRGLIDSGALVRAGAGWRFAPEAAVTEIPSTIHGLLLARLDRLPPGPRRLLQEAAVLGQLLGERLLVATCSEPAAVAAHLDLLVQAELLGELPRPTEADLRPERRFGFRHALMQEVAYQSLLVRRRTELHGRAAAALEGLVGDGPRRLEDLEALGHHYSLSAEKLKGVHFLVAAGDWARDSFANEDAARYYQRALQTLEAGDPDEQAAERRSLRERLATVLERLGRREAALGHYLWVLESCQEIGDLFAQARLRRQIGALLWEAGERDRALGYYQSGLALLEGGPEHIEQALLYQELGRLAFRSGENRQAIDWAERALGLAERLMTVAAEQRAETALAVAQARNTLGIALARAGDQDSAVDQLEGGLAVALEHELYQAAGRAYANLGVLYSSFDPGRAIEASLAGLELARKIGHLSLQPWLYANLAGAYCTFTGQCEQDGLEAAQAAVELDRQLSQLDHLAVPLIVLGQIYQCHGDSELAFQQYQEALGLAEEMREPQLLFPVYEGLATLYLEAGQQQQAELYLEKGQQVCEQAGLDPDSLVILPFLG